MILTHKFTTKNGLKVLLIKRPEKYTVGVSFLINAGSIYEDFNTSGISHFFEHLYFNGTKSYPSEEGIRVRFQELGVSFNAATHHDKIQVYGTFPKTESSKSLKLLREMIFESLLTTESIEKERDVIYSEIRQRGDDNSTFLWDEINKIRFRKGNPLNLPIGGTQESVKNLEVSKIKEYYKKFNNPKNCMLILGSSLSFTKAEELIRLIFQDVPSGVKIPAKNYSLKDMSIKQIIYTQRQADHLYLNISFPTHISSDIYSNWKYSFMNMLLGEKLNNRLRIENGLVYGINVFNSLISKDTGASVIQTSFHPERIELILEIIFDEIKQIKLGNIDEVAFERLRKVGNKTLPMAFDSMSGALNWVLGSYYYDGIVYTPEESILARDKVTLIDIKNAGNEVYDNKNINIAGLGSTVENVFIKLVKKNINT